MSTDRIHARQPRKKRKQPKQPPAARAQENAKRSHDKTQAKKTQADKPEAKRKNQPAAQKASSRKERTSHRSPSEGQAANNSQPLESIASLVGRLGPPRKEVARLLIRRFETACQKALQSGVEIREISLEQWDVTQSGHVSFSAAPNASSSRKATAAQVEEQTRRLTEQFERLIAPGFSKTPTSTWQPTMPQDRIAGTEPIQKNAVNAAPAPAAGISAALSAAALEEHSIEESDPSQFSKAQQHRRDEISGQLLQALAERFGEDVLIDPAAENLEERPVLQPLKQDRPFNWNLVFGIVVAAIVLAMIGFGIYVSDQRAKEAARVLRESSAASSASSEDDSEPADAPPVFTLRPSASLPKLSDTDVADLIANTPEERFDLPMDASETLQTQSAELVTELLRSTLDATTTPLEGPSGEIDALLEDIKETSLSGEAFRPGNVLSGAPLDSGEASPSAGEPNSLDDLLEEVSEGEMAGSGIPTDSLEERSEKTRVANRQALRLPSLAEQRADFQWNSEPGDALELQFPVKTPIEIKRHDAGKYVFLTEASTSPIAGLQWSGLDGKFSWADDTPLSAATQLARGRLVTGAGDVIYLRPAKEADAFPLGLMAASKRLSWEMGGPILPNATKVELDWSVPETVDLSWTKPFAMDRSTRGTAVAIVEPLDGESVAIGVQLLVKLGRKLELRTKFFARLDPELPWCPVTRKSLDAIVIETSDEMQSASFQLEQLKKNYSLGDDASRRMNRGRLKESEAAVETLRATLERLSELERVFSQLEQSTLKMEVYVPWPVSSDGPDAAPGRQTLLSLVDRQPGSSDEEDAEREDEG
ncbi:MAG: hypothetical protein AAFV88_18270 [Planctomycetota bacterium]